MPVILDARGNEYQGSLDQIVGGTVTDARGQTASLGSLNAETALDLNGHTECQIDLRTGAITATLVFEGTIDGTNYWPLVAYDPQIQQFISQIVSAGALTKNVYISVSGFKRVRIRVSAYTSGAVTVAARATFADFMVLGAPIPTTLSQTGTAAVNTGVTITLPAAGAGLFHYITALQIVKFYSVLGVAAAAPVLVTTTNLPGGPVFTFDQSAATQGQQTAQLFSWAGNPLKSSVANTATTIVAPVQLQTIWRINVTYYVGA